MQAAGQTVALLHTMAVLQAYQTDLLKDLDKAFYKVQVWARTTRGPSPSRSGDQRWAQKASLVTHALPRLRIGLERGAGQREAKPWGRCSRRGVLNNTFVQTRVRHLLLYLRGASALLFLSNSPATTVNSTPLVLNIEVSILDLWCFRLSSMFPRNYLTDGPVLTLRTSLRD